MKKEVFCAFWDKWSSEWYKAKIEVDGQSVPVAELCELVPGCEHVIHDYYETIKQIVKDSYFKDTSKLLSRYKRAAVVAYAINEASPLNYKDPAIQCDMDSNFLKQRLAFFVALGSIIQDYSERDVDALERPYFDFGNLGKSDIVDGEDDFCQSVYKDLFYAGIYENYNVLTMANVFGLLTERASNLSSLTPGKNKCPPDEHR